MRKRNAIRTIDRALFLLRSAQAVPGAFGRPESLEAEWFMQQAQARLLDLRNRLSLECETPKTARARRLARRRKERALVAARRHQ
jgi:hypothetical protein